MDVSFFVFYRRAFRDFIARSFHCKNRIKIVVFASAMIAARLLIWSDRRGLMHSRRGGRWVLPWRVVGASWWSIGCLLGDPSVFPGLASSTLAARGFRTLRRRPLTGVLFT